ncbi:hypothetical protein DH2020_008243 [Rehmannia glutinosa]|uniref:non-specific serine/threonine protein kinase n=1 Tax=Rehmannia glutinosa TaxID=99300 RepID=A0ABR0U0G1_REHGL
MSDGKPAFLKDELSRRTSVFGLRLWVVFGICVFAAIVIFLFLISLWFTSRRNKKSSLLLITHKNSSTIPNVSREIQEIRLDPTRVTEDNPKLLLPEPGSHPNPEPDPNEDKRVHIEFGKGNRIAYPEKTGPGSGSGETRAGGEPGSVMAGPEVSHLGWGHWYTLRELEEATNGFADENVIGEGGYGIVYHGVFEDNSKVAVKNLLNNRGQAEREFKVEVEAIGRVRHKNLVRLLGYCAEGAHRMLVYEYVDNGNLEQWLHGDVGPRSPLTWDTRMNIILGTAKGLTYLHEGLEPKVVHRDIKSNNILLDGQWNAKVSDFEYASTGMLNERSDVYSFGILIMEIISGRNPVDYSLAEKPSSRALKRTLLVALRCVDPNAQKRPKMGHVVHMLEADDFPFRDERRGGREHVRSNRDGIKEKRITEPDDSSGCESGIQTDRFSVRKQETDEEK